MQSAAQWTCLIVLSTTTWGLAQDGDIRRRDVDDARIEQMIRERKAKEDTQMREPTSLDDGASVNPKLLEVVRDNSFGLRYEERDIYFRMLELALRTPLAQQERFVAQFREDRRLAHLEFAQQYLGVRLDELPTPMERNRLRLARALQQPMDEFPTFQDMLLYPNENRGRPVSIHGVMRKLTKFDPGKNERGIRDAFEAWIYTKDSPAIPTVVVFINKPEHLDVGGDLAEEVQVTGYFLKMYAYQGQEKPTRAPLILAEGLLWKPSQRLNTYEAIPWEIYLAMTIFALLVGYAMWQWNRREMTSQLHPRIDVDFQSFPPIEHPIHHMSGEKELKPVEPNDS